MGREIRERERERERERKEEKRRKKEVGERERKMPSHVFSPLYYEQSRKKFRENFYTRLSSQQSREYRIYYIWNRGIRENEIFK